MGILLTLRRINTNSTSWQVPFPARAEARLAGDFWERTVRRPRRAFAAFLQ